ncbi:MAG: lysophospholipid acyltransferase family protein [Erythrobacter sp.]
MSVLRSLVYYPAFYGGSIILVSISLVAVLLGPAQLQAVVRNWSRWHRWCVTRLLGVELVVEGQRPEGPVLFAVKHESFFEAIDTPAFFANPSVFAKRELFDIPGWGRSALRYGLIPVARDEGARALRQMLASARQRLAEGRPLVIFPEGTRVPHGSQPPLQAGFAGLYKLLGMQVVPVAVNSGPLYQRLWKRPGRITYRIGEPIPPGLPREEIEARVHAAINALNEPAG